MPTKETTRQMGYAVTKLYRNAFATYRNEIYRVKDIVSGKQIILDWDVYESMKQRIRLLDPNLILNLPEVKKPLSEVDYAEYYQEFINNVPIKEIRKVICRLDEDLQSFMCDRCHFFTRRITPIKSLGKFIFLCPNCSTKNNPSFLKQTPILRYNRPLKAERSPPKIIRPIPARKCPKCGEWMHLFIKDVERPMASLTRECPKCKYQERLQTMPYRPIAPSEQLTKGITVSFANAKDLKEIPKIDLLDYNYVKGVYFANKVEVSQVTFGYKLGQFDITINKGFEEGEYFGRKFFTQGLVIDLNPEVYLASRTYLKKLYEKDPKLFEEFEADLESEEDMEELQLKRWVLHTLAHSLLVMLPIFTGLPTSEFNASYDLNKDRVIIYDNQDGGIGGSKKFEESKDLFYDYFDTIIRTITRCDCRSKCPKCIVLNFCGEVNQALNRHLLTPIFENIETYYD